MLPPTVGLPNCHGRENSLCCDSNVIRTSSNDATKNENDMIIKPDKISRSSSTSTIAIITSDEKLRSIAQTRWLSVSEIAFLLSDYQRILKLHEKAPMIRPESGDIFLYDRSIVKRYKTDHHDWIKKRHNVKKIREDHVKLRINGVPKISGCYVHSSTIPSMHRRSYHLLQSNDNGKATSATRAANSLVLVHYLDLDVAASALSSNENKCRTLISSSTSSSLSSSSSPMPIVSSHSTSPATAGTTSEGTRSNTSSRASKTDDYQVTHYRWSSTGGICNIENKEDSMPVAYRSISESEDNPPYLTHSNGSLQSLKDPRFSFEEAPRDTDISRLSKDERFVSNHYARNDYFDRSCSNEETNPIQARNSRKEAPRTNSDHVGSSIRQESVYFHQEPYYSPKVVDNDPWHLNWIPPFKGHINGRFCSDRRSTIERSKMESLRHPSTSTTGHKKPNEVSSSRHNENDKTRHCDHRTTFVVNGRNWDGPNESNHHSIQVSPSSRAKLPFRSICWELSDSREEDKAVSSGGGENLTSNEVRPVPRLLDRPSPCYEYQTHETPGIMNNCHNVEVQQYHPRPSSEQRDCQQERQVCTYGEPFIPYSSNTSCRVSDRGPMTGSFSPFLGFEGNNKEEKVQTNQNHDLAELNNQGQFYGTTTEEQRNGCNSFDMSVGPQEQEGSKHHRQRSYSDSFNCSYSESFNWSSFTECDTMKN